MGLPSRPVTLYRDRFIECTDDELIVRWYYFPFGTKHIPYSAVNSFQRVELTAFHGKGRIWGTGNLRYWASLDPSRGRKSLGLTLDLGKAVQPFITPDDADTVAEIIANKTGRRAESTQAPLL